MSATTTGGTNGKPHYDAETVRQAARGHWLEILNRIGKYPLDSLDGGHHGCPICGQGKDCFRLIDESAGAVLCNKCFSRDNGDGFAALMKATGKSFVEVLADVAELCGVQPSKNGKVKKKTKTPEDAVNAVWLATDERLRDLSNIHIQKWCANKPPITPAAVRKFGGCYARWPKDGGDPCIAFQGSDLAGAIRSVLLYRVDGKMFPAFKTLSERKTHLVGGSVESWITPDGADLQEATTIIKWEGMTDNLAGYSAGLPDGYIGITNTCGAKSANPAKLDFRFAAGRNMIIAVDADQPGIEGGRRFVVGFHRAGALSVKIVAPPGYEITVDHGKDFRDWFCEGHTMAEFLALADATEAVTAEQVKEWDKACRKRRSNSGREIIIGTDETRVIDEAIAALASCENVYQRGGALVEVLHDATTPHGIRSIETAPRISAFALPRLQELLADSADWKQPGDEEHEDKPAHPPSWAVKAVNARGAWSSIRPIVGIVEAPTVRSDGTVLQVPGYDPTTGLIYRPSCEYPLIPAALTVDNARRAVAILLDVVADVPFATPAHRSGWLGFLLTMIGRHAFAGCAPLTLIDSNVRGSGKSLSVDVASIIATGRNAPRMTLPRDEDEMRKRITSVVVAALQLVMIDNTTRLGGDALDAALTADVWQDRILGRTEMVTLPLGLTWCATGNNVQVLGDTIRRVLPVRIETTEENPEERTGFRHPDLRDWVRQSRPKLATAGATILAAYCAAGRPGQGLASWGSFESWSGLIRSAIVWAGEPDPAGNRREMMSAADTEGALLRRLLDGWQEADPSGHGLTVSEALHRVAEFPDEFEALRSALLELIPPGKSPSPRAIGMKLHHIRGRVVAGRCFQRRDGKEGAIWRVVSVEAGGLGGTRGTKANPHTHAPGRAHAGARTRDLQMAGASPSSPSTTPCNHDDVAETPTSDGRYINRKCRTCGADLRCRPVTTRKESP